MKKLGVAVLGLFVGLLAGFVIHEMFAIALFATTGDVPRAQPFSAMIKFITPVCGVLGVGAALAIDRRHERNTERNTS